MASQLVDWIQISLSLFNQSSDRIIWNLFLAFIPLALSFYLFRLSATRNLTWWLSLLIFASFLPNAPYILTDSIHIIELSQNSYPTWAIVLILIPQYVWFITIGFEAYVISLTKLDSYLSNLVTKKYLILVRAIVHGLCVVGIYLGRFERFNSWDLVTEPKKVIFTTWFDLLDRDRLLSLAIAFIILWLLSEMVRLTNQRIGLNRKIGLL